MTKYIFNNEEYTLEQVQSAAQESGVDIDTYIKEAGLETVSEDFQVEQPVEKPQAAAETTAPAVAQPVDTDLQSESGFLDLVPYNQSDLDSIANNFERGNFRKNQKAAYDSYKQTGVINESLLPPKKKRRMHGSF